MTRKQQQQRFTLVAPTPSPTVQSLSASPPATTQAYGWRNEQVREQIPTYPHENWLIYQAKSYLGRDVSIDEAKELFSRIDINTRQPIQSDPPESFLVRLLGRFGLLR